MAFVSGAVVLLPERCGLGQFKCSEDYGGGLRSGPPHTANQKKPRRAVAVQSLRGRPNDTDGERDDDRDTGREALGGRVARWALGSDIPLPLNTQVKSGYLLAAVSVAFVGGGTITVAFVPFLALGLGLDMSPLLAAGAAGLTALLVDLLRLNILSAVGGMTGTSGTVGSPILPLLFFASIVGATAGVTSETEAKDEPANGDAGERYRRVLRDRVKERSKAESGEKEVEELPSSDDFLEWDKKFKKQSSRNYEE